MRMVRQRCQSSDAALLRLLPWRFVSDGAVAHLGLRAIDMAAELHGRPVREAIERLGSLAQAVSVESSTRTDGPDAGSRRIRLVNGPLDVEILPDRGLDIGQVRAGGIPLAWISATGFAPLSPGDADERGWMRAFGGGLLTTCGLMNFGPPSIDAGERHPMHGRYSSLRATVTRAEARSDEVVVEGVVREATVFGADLELRRRISLPVGEPVLRVQDVVVNRGPRPVEPMVLYHLNLGWPLVDAGTVLQTPASSVVPRDAQAAVGADTWDVFPDLMADYPEQVFAHELPLGRRVEATVTSPTGLGVRIGVDSAALPGLFQWRVAEKGHYVLGVEPATVPTIRGRGAARDAGLLRPLAPGEELALGVDLVVELPGR